MRAQGSGARGQGPGARLQVTGYRLQVAVSQSQITNHKSQIGIRLSTVHCTLFTLSLLLLTLPSSGNPYDQAMRRVRALSNSQNVRLIPFGKSHKGRAIPAFAVSDFTVTSEKKARVLVCAGQHGNERNPVWSVLSLCGKLASGARPDLLKRCVIVVVPIVNPDGFAARTRLNAQGRDINRDWATLKTPEARFVHRLVRTWRPHAMLDAHEWTGPTLTPGNEIESPPTATKGQSASMLSLARAVEQRSALVALRCSPIGNTTLFHRRYSSKGYAAFLVETAAGVSYQSKRRAYGSAILTVARAAADSQARTALSPSSKGFCLSLVAPYLEALPPDPLPVSQGFTLVLVLAVGYCLILWVMRSGAREADFRWSHRFKKCDVAPEVEWDPLAFRHSLRPLTSKSWISRRLRSRYATASPGTTTEVHG